MSASATLFDFDMRNLAVWDDPYPHLARARSAGRILRGGAGQWVVTRYDDVAALLRDSRLSHEFPAEYYRLTVGDGPANSFVRRIILNRDPPGHTELRKVMSRVLSPHYVAGLGPRIQGFADELVRAPAATGELEVVEDLAFPLPVMVACELIGIPQSDRPLIRGWASDLTMAFTSIDLGPHERSRADDAVTSLRDYVDELLSRRERTLGSDNTRDLSSLLLASLGASDTLTRDDVVDNVVFLFFAGFETTVNLIATGTAALLEHPAELHRLREDRSLLATAIEEFLRWDGPIPTTSRLVREPLEVAGRKLRPGRVVHLLLAAANRDERRFESPDRLDVGRRPNPHLGFSGGPHYCLGAALARLESTAAFAAILDHCADLGPAGPAIRRRDPSFRSYQRVPASCRPYVG